MRERGKRVNETREQFDNEEISFSIDYKGQKIRHLDYEWPNGKFKIDIFNNMTFHLPMFCSVLVNEIEVDFINLSWDQRMKGEQNFSFMAGLFSDIGFGREGEISEILTFNVNRQTGLNGAGLKEHDPFAIPPAQMFCFTPERPELLNTLTGRIEFTMKCHVRIPWVER